MKPEQTTKTAASSSKSIVLLRKTLLLQEGITVKILSTKLHCSPQFCSQLISGGRRSQEKEQMIANLLGVPRRVLWPL